MLTGRVAPPDWPSPLLRSTDEFAAVGGGELLFLSLPPFELPNHRLFRGLETDCGVLVPDSAAVGSLVVDAFCNPCVRLDVS